ncbi:MAG: molybdopterin-dependent oxidoreductase [Bellilinea sp.]
MSDKISRRDFLKIAGAGAAVSAVLTGCGPATRYIVRRPYTEMPEYNQTGLNTYYASTCRECPAGCGIIVRTKEGRAITIEGNPQHPVNRGRLCARGITAQQGLYNPDRVLSPMFQARGDASRQSKTSWDDAITLVTDALKSPASQIAFLMGTSPDHLYDLVTELAESIDAPAPVRYSALSSFEGRATLQEAANRTFGKPALPFFDLANAEVVFSFGASFLETWLSPVSYSAAYGDMRQARTTRRGYLVTFEARQSMTAGNADEWYPIKPGSEGTLALGLARLIAEFRRESDPTANYPFSIDSVVEATGIEETRLRELARLFASSDHALAIPGGNAIGQPGGLANAQAIMQLNAQVGNIGLPGGVYLTNTQQPPSNLEGVKALIQKMNNSQVQVLFVHGVNPVFELPKVLGFEEALAKVPLVISFASFPDETAMASDYILPDHTPLESFGYQRMLAGADRPVYSSIQPVVAPLYDTRATADVLLTASNLPYSDEVDFVQQKIVPLISAGGFYTAPEIQTFWSRWLQYGGWWVTERSLDGDLDVSSPGNLTFGAPVTIEEGKQFYLVVYPTQLGDGSGANRPWLQEMPDPMTTLTWNTWVEINPETADKLGIHDDDVVRVTTAYGAVEASVYRYPAIRPDTIAIPFGQGHTALGRWAEGRGANPANLLPADVNEAGDMAFSGITASISLTGKRRPLARVESRDGVYGEH